MKFDKFKFKGTLKERGVSTIIIEYSCKSAPQLSIEKRTSGMSKKSGVRRDVRWVFIASLLAMQCVVGCSAAPHPDSGVPNPDSGVPHPDPGKLYLDGKELSSVESGPAPAIVLDGGLHQLTGEGSASFTLKNNIEGPGQLKIDLPANATVSLEGTLSHGGFVVSSGILDLTRAIDRSGEASVVDGGVLKRLATPNDISSSSRLWLDSNRSFTLFTDSAGTIPVKSPDNRVNSWSGLERRDKKLVTSFDGTGQYLGAGEGVKSTDMYYFVGQLKLQIEYTYALVVRPVAMPIGTDTCIITSIFDPNYVNLASSICFTLPGDSTKSVLKFAYSMASWNANNMPWSDMEARDTSSKRYFLNDGGVDVIMTAFGGDAGQVLQLNGTPVASYPDKRVSDSDIQPDLAYYIGTHPDLIYNVDLVIKEVVVTGDIKSADALTGYLAWRHGMQAKLREDHPYKLGPPTAVIDSKGTSVYRPCEGGKSCLLSTQPSCAPLCPAASECRIDDDCLSRVCANGKCT